MQRGNSSIWHAVPNPPILTCLYAVVLEILDVIVSKEVFTNLEEIEGKMLTTKRVSSGVRLG